MTALTAAPAEVVKIDPESLEIANCYLQTPDIQKVANTLGVGAELVATTLKKREVKAYVDAVFKDLGYNNRVKMRELMDAVIKKKLMDMDEADLGSSKDIIDILTTSHKMSMDHLNAEIALEKIKLEVAKAAAEPTKSQVNVQINNEAPSSNYGALLEKLLANGTNREVPVDPITEVEVIDASST